MDWHAPIDIYCERTDPSFWSEPVNALTNLAFLIAAIIAFEKTRDDGASVILSVILFAIGIGSGLFHTFATGWGSALDVLAILFFILAYIFFATWRFLERPVWQAVLAVFLFFAYAAVAEPVLTAITGPLNGSVPYLAVALLIALYGVALVQWKPAVARGLWIGAGILCVSIFFRSIDEFICPSLPLGTHFLWHVLNAIMLYWMIIIMHRHRAAT